MPRVSVIIACRNERPYIRDAVTALLNGSEPDVEVLIVDGRSTDGTRAVLAELAASDARVMVLDNPARITPIAFNIGIQHATGEYIAICGAHAVPAPDWVERSLAALEEHPEAVATGGVLETVAGTGIGAVIAAVMSSRFGVGNARFRTGGAAGYVDTVVFGLYRRRAFDYGLFDEQLATNQDDELNTRLVARGEKLWFDPSIQCRYFCRPSWGAMIRQYWRYGRYKLLVFRKAGRVGSLRQLAPGAWAAFLLASVAFIRPASPLIALYILLGVVAASQHIARLGVRSLLFVPVAASLHLAYGFGFWAGVLSFAEFRPAL